MRCFVDCVRGREGFGGHGKLHRKGLFGISDDRPITIMAADEEAKIRSVIPEIQEMVKEGLLLVVDAEAVGKAGSSG